MQQHYWCMTASWLSIAWVLVCLPSAAVTQTVCGDGVCESTEVTGGCRIDCYSTCGDGVCVRSDFRGSYPIENATSCEKDCKPVCGDGICAKTPLPQFEAETSLNCPDDCKPTCGNGVCEHSIENYFNCRDDCNWAKFDGVLVVRDEGATVTHRPSFSIQAINKVPVATAVNELVGYVNTTGDGRYEMLLQGSHIRASLVINGATILSYENEDTKSFNITQKVILPTGYIHNISVQYSTSKYNHSLTLFWRPLERLDSRFVPINNVFYSKNVCGDGIIDEDLSCNIDLNNYRTIDYTEKGFGLCLNKDPNLDFADCHPLLTTTCSPTKVFPTKFFAGLPTSGDTFGSFIDNQMLWRLPGVDLLSYGIDFISGERRLSPLFYFSYCNSSTLQVVQDAYRGNTYIVPEELYAQASPKCSFSMESTKYSSSSEMSLEMAQNSGTSASANAGGAFDGIGININAAYSKEQSVSQAKSLEGKASGSLISTHVDCETSKVKMSKITWHPGFLEDLAKAETDEDFVRLVKRYGTHYYKHATLGGRLKQITVMTSGTESSQTETDQTQSAQRSFGASVSSPIFSVGGSYSDTTDNSVEGDQQTEFERNSFRSTVITYGGPPGSFGPTGSTESPTTFGNWASSIDLLPVPINYEVGFISDKIPTTWTSKSGEKIVDLWNRAVEAYAEGEAEAEAADLGLTKYLVLYKWFRSTGSLNEYSLTLVVQNSSQVLFGSSLPGVFDFFRVDQPFVPYYMAHLTAYFPTSISSIDTIQVPIYYVGYLPMITADGAWFWLLNENTGKLFAFNSPFSSTEQNRVNETWPLADKDAYPAAGLTCLMFELKCTGCEVLYGADQYVDIKFKGKNGFRNKNFMYKLDYDQIPKNTSKNPLIFKELGTDVNLRFDVIEVTWRSLTTNYVPDINVVNVIIVDSQLKDNSTAAERTAYFSIPDIPYTLTISNEYRVLIPLKAGY